MKGKKCHDKKIKSSEVNPWRDWANLSLVAPARTEASFFILDMLRNAPDNILPVREISAAAKAAGLSDSSVRKAKAQLKKSEVVKMYSKGYSTDKIFYMQLVQWPTLAQTEYEKSRLFERKKEAIAMAMAEGRQG